MVSYFVVVFNTQPHKTHISILIYSLIKLKQMEMGSMVMYVCSQTAVETIIVYLTD